MSALTLDVTASDDRAHSTTTTVSVAIIGVNTQPTFPDCHSYRASVFENAAVRTVVLEVVDSFMTHSILSPPPRKLCFRQTLFVCLSVCV